MARGKLKENIGGGGGVGGGGETPCKPLNICLNHSTTAVYIDYYFKNLQMNNILMYFVH